MKQNKPAEASRERAGKHAVEMGRGGGLLSAWTQEESLNIRMFW